MALSRHIFLATAIVGLILAAQVFATTAGHAATSTTKTIILPVEDPEKSPSETPAAPAIPDDELPKVEPEVVEEDDPNEVPLPSDDTASSPLPPVLRDTDLLPAAVRKTHEQLMSAATRADLEALRSLIGTGDLATTLSIGGLEGDPIDYLKEVSGDEDGYEVLAILLEVLEAGFVHVDAGTENEMYIWPYFFTWPLEKLTPQMKVELFRILTAGDVQDSVEFGGYIFYRVGIRPDGRWDFFVAGD